MLHNVFIFVSQALTHHNFAFNSWFLYKLRHKLHLSKTVCGTFHFQFHLFLIKVCIFFSTKSMDSLNLKRHNSFSNKNNRKPTHSFAPRPMIFKLQQEVQKFSDICESWCSQKIDLKTNFLILGNWSVESVDFSQ